MGACLGSNKDPSVALNKAIQRGDLNAVKKLLADNPTLVALPIYDKDGFPVPPLSVALVSGNLEISREIIAQGAYIGETTANHSSALHAAALCPAPADALSLLLERSPPDMIRTLSIEADLEGNTPLHTAIQTWFMSPTLPTGWKEFLTSLFAVGGKTCMQYKNRAGYNPLELALRATELRPHIEHVELMGYLMENYELPDKDPGSEVGLYEMFAARGFGDLAPIFIDKDVDLDALAAMTRREVLAVLPEETPPYVGIALWNLVQDFQSSRAVLANTTMFRNADEEAGTEQRAIPAPPRMRSESEMQVINRNGAVSAPVSPDVTPGSSMSRSAGASSTSGLAAERPVSPVSPSPTMEASSESTGDVEPGEVVVEETPSSPSITSSEPPPPASVLATPRAPEPEAAASSAADAEQAAPASPPPPTPPTSSVVDSVKAADQSPPVAPPPPAEALAAAPAAPSDEPKTSSGESEPASPVPAS